MKQLAIAFALLVAACGGKSSSTTTTPEGEGGDEEAPAAEVVTLDELQNGDEACYVVFTHADGSQDNVPGVFELCGGPDERSGLIGQQVVLTIGQHQMNGPTCEGDPECTDQVMADMVEEITAAP